MINVTKIRPVEAELFHADRQTNMTNLTVGFRNFAKAVNKDRHKNPFKLQRKLLETNIITST
jgi:hypothetical protein